MGRISLIVGLLVLMLSDASAATTVDDGSFGTIYEVFKMWIGDSLGLAIALLGTIGILLWYMLNIVFAHLTHMTITPATPEFLIKSLMFPIFVGGVVGLIETMAGIGRTTFG